MFASSSENDFGADESFQLISKKRKLDKKSSLPCSGKSGPSGENSGVVARAPACPSNQSLDEEETSQLVYVSAAVAQSSASGTRSKVDSPTTTGDAEERENVFDVSFDFYPRLQQCFFS